MRGQSVEGSKRVFLSGWERVMGEEVGGDGGAGLPAPSHGEMAMQGCPLPTDSEEESGAAGPARPLPSMQTFAFQTQMRRCRASGKAGGGGRASSTPLALSAPTPAPCVCPSDHLCPHHLPPSPGPPCWARFSRLGGRAGSGLSHQPGLRSPPGAASAWCGSAGRRPVGACWLPRSCPTTPRTGLPCCGSTRPSRAYATHTWRSCRLPTSAPGTWSSSWSCAPGLSCSPVWPRGEGRPGLDSRPWLEHCGLPPHPPPCPASARQPTSCSVDLGPPS